jgi:hypothetical protein
MQNTKIIIIIVIIIAISWFLYKYFVNIEGFTSDNLDLLDKQSSNQINNNTSSYDGTTISQWSNKFYNFQVQNSIKPLSLWKPKLPVSNGKSMCKLGDMVSTSPEYAPPTDKSLFVNGDVLPPIDYKVIVDYKGMTMDPIFNDLHKSINSLNDLNNLYNSLKNTVSVITTINGIITNGKNDIINLLDQRILSNIKIGLVNNNNTLLSLSSAVSPSNILPLNSTDLILLPANCIITIYKLSSDNRPSPNTSPIILNYNINSNRNNSRELANYLGSQNYFGSISSSNINFIPSTIGLMDIPNIANMINNYTNSMQQEINLIKTSNPDVYKILNLENFIQNLMSFLQANFSYTYSYPVVTLPVSSLTNTNLDLQTTKLGYTVNPYNSLEFAKILQSMNYPNDITQIPSYTNSLFAKVCNGITLLGELGALITTNSLDIFSLKIVEPIAPPHYKCLGHIFMNNNDTIENIKNNVTIGCVPESCVKEVRNWRITDMIFEYNSSNMYFNIFYNPYVGTFIATTKKGIPFGKVCKVVACVKPCTVVDELIKADQCARDLQKMNKSIASEKPLSLSISANEEDTYYLDKIAKQSSFIAMLEKKAKNLQVNTDKADIINQEYNKSRLQKFVDTQAKNIDIVMKNLENNRNTADIDVDIPLNVINQILDLIKSSDTLSPEERERLLKSILDNKNLADKGLITGAQYKQILSKALKTCNDFDTNGYIRKDIASQVCYGCSDPK